MESYELYNVSVCSVPDLLSNNRQKIRAAARVWEDKSLTPSLIVFLIHSYVKTFQRTWKLTLCSGVTESLINVAFFTCKHLVNVILLVLSLMYSKLDLTQQQCLSMNPSCQPAWLPVSRIWVLTYLNKGWLKLTILIHHRDFKDTMVRQRHFKDTFESNSLETDFFTTYPSHRTWYTVPAYAAESAMCRSSSKSNTNHFHTHHFLRRTMVRVGTLMSSVVSVGLLTCASDNVHAWHALLLLWSSNVSSYSQELSWRKMFQSTMCWPHSSSYLNRNRDNVVCPILWQHLHLIPVVLILYVNIHTSFPRHSSWHVDSLCRPTKCRPSTR